MKPNELEIITKLTGAPASEITLADDGFCSRGYIIDHGRIVFKFKKTPETSYVTEIKTLDFVNSLDLGISLQKVGWISPDDSYLGIYGIVGNSLEATPNPDYERIGQQLAHALQQLHQAHPESADTCTLAAEISAWQERYQDARDLLAHYFSPDELVKLDTYMTQTVPASLTKLGEQLVFSHGDLGDGNIFVDTAGNAGIIDFSEMSYLDEAADFMDVQSEELCHAMLDSYGADDILREKTRIRRELRPLIVFGNYARRGDTQRVNDLVAKIRRLLVALP